MGISKHQLRDMTFSDEQLQTVKSAVVLLLRRHSSNNQLCCENNENDLEVKPTCIDSYGFVTKVKCMKCNKTMETTCYDDKCTYERIYDEKKELKLGDHICWRRRVGYWHHAIVMTVEPEISVISYDDLRVEKKSLSKSEIDSFCNALYRINYHDCYGTDYSILRARMLKDESR